MFYAPERLRSRKNDMAFYGVHTYFLKFLDTLKKTMYNNYQVVKQGGKAEKNSIAVSYGGNLRSNENVLRLQ